ncbi:copper amine oxidase N-terminal domain-containing protein [Paenibacillus segetis]|uniref:Copper amine oxidase-like N-terminal domain-containing protein n=1 Tax=Paenibacillus segetis TaxID=1325360 RepID=A0ABQ1YRY6_9BACL|nr:copper amine oxidase N-terminal domain-containing protein [Paenibacillus segetis]GGH36104.1 hypothetical protein GCM10008013_42750 [Paenibacillus segetis]
MKKVLLGAFLAFSLLTLSSTTYAAGAKIQLKVDGVAITSEVKPESKNNRIMVPLRLISENLGAIVEWSKSEVILVKGDMKVVLKLNSAVAEKNGEKMQLDVKPYLKNNSVFVPLRFITEAFDCNVSYSNNVVTVDTEPLVIDGIRVQALQQEYHMIMGGIISQFSGNTYNEAVYNIFMKNKGDKVEAPASYSWNYNLDTPGAYYKNAQYDFLDQKGDSIVRFDVYTLTQGVPSELLSGYPKTLVHDALQDEWYLFSDAALKSINQLMDNAVKNGFQKIISNTVA